MTSVRKMRIISSSDVWCFALSLVFFFLVAADAALQYVQAGTIVGIGTGSTANFFIDSFATIKHKIDGTVASSNASAERLKKYGIPVLDLNNVDDMALYVDGAD